MTQRMKSKVIFDGRNVFDLAQMKDWVFIMKASEEKQLFLNQCLWRKRRH
jgi:hypothetical protein